MSDIKKFMYVNRRAPYGTIYAWESLEVVLIGAAFDQEVSLFFVDDGVFQLVKGSDTSESDMKNFMPTYRTLGDYGVRHMYVDKASLEARGLTQDDLIQVEWEDFETEEEVDNIVEVVDTDQAAQLVAASEVVFSF
ncbi:MAG: sulfurtransferase complex subunit TusC [Gammaproteobacteria bacterium]|nr:sulfurtransferase complex subunit TusC [Gammaproteobacteria bacterium]